MKKYYIYILSLVLITGWSCSSSAKKDDQGEHTHSHADGETCGHDHDHEEHSHTHDHQHAEGEECDHDHDHDHTGHDHNHGEIAEAGDEIVFTAQQAKDTGLETVKIDPSTFHHIIKTSGQVLSAQGDEVTVSATVSGIVSFTRSSLSEGTSVRAGESLLGISAKNMGEGDPVIKARSAYNIAKQEYDRAESLIGDKLISQKEYNEIKLNYENAKVTYEALGRNLSGKGASMSSSISGYVKSILVSEGQYVEVGQPLLTVTQNRRLQLRADVSERYYKDLGNIVSANFRTPYEKEIYKLSDLNGRLTSYGKSASNQEYYIPVNFEFDNIGQIVSGSYVEVFLLSKPKTNTITVPMAALVEEQGIYSVYLQLDKEHYKKQEVKTGQNDGQNVEILSGLKAGDRVVSKGAYHVRLASASGTIPHAHEH